LERVAFLIEPSQERIGCLLNPESVVMRRSAGIRPLGRAPGRFTGIQLADDPVLFTGGGRTELEFDLLFDVSLAGSTIASDDVRALTKPIWDLAENDGDPGDYGRPRSARMVWGTAWNVLGVVTDVAERLEQFTPDGTPTRSWLRLRMRRVGPASDDDRLAREGAQPDWHPAPAAPAEPPPPSDADTSFQVAGGGQRLDDVAARVYGGRCELWRYIAAANNVDTAPWVPAGQVLRIPPLPAGGR
jgi:nucleoid-associated protein YgaU